MSVGVGVNVIVAVGVCVGVLVAVGVNVSEGVDVGVGSTSHPSSAAFTARRISAMLTLPYAGHAVMDSVPKSMFTKVMSSSIDTTPSALQSPIQGSGVSVGVAAGVSVGVTVGEVVRVGVAVRVLVAVGVCVDVLVTVDAAVGVLVGVSVGVSVGGTVGDGVGSGVRGLPWASRGASGRASASVFGSACRWRSVSANSSTLAPPLASESMWASPWGLASSLMSVSSSGSPSLCESASA